MCVADKSIWLPRDGTPVHCRLTNPTPSINWNPLKYHMVVVLKRMWYRFHQVHLGLGLTTEIILLVITTPNRILLQPLALMFFDKTILIFSCFGFCKHTIAFRNFYFWNSVTQKNPISTYHNCWTRIAFLTTDYGILVCCFE